MGDLPTDTVLAHQMMRKLVSHEVDVNGPFEPRIDSTLSRHFEILKRIPAATAEGEGSVCETSIPFTKKVVLNFPDLQVHILRQDERNVSRMIKSNPSSVSEKNCFGQNSVHVAVIVGNLKVLQTILYYAEALPLNTSDYAKFRGRYPIDYAVMPHLHGACHIEDDIECSGCDILGALLESDCALYPSFFLGIFFGCTRNYGGTADCALKKVILFLKERRQRLTEYAKKHLPPAQAAELGLYGTNVLDEAAGAVQTALQERSIFIPLSLRVYDADSESWQDWNFRSLHSYLSDRGTAAYVWELGFRDLGVDLATGFYELWDFILDHDTTQNDWRRSKIISHVYWLLERGADLGKPLPCPIPAHINQTSWTAAHLLSAYLARYNNSERGEIGNHLQGEIAQATTSISILDDCRCACTSNGCSPLLILLNGMVVWRRQWWEKWRRQWLEKPSPTLDDYVYDFQWFCEFWAISVESRPWDNSSKPTQVFRLILRYMTFTALGLRHSCCRLAQFEATRDWDIKDMDEIMEEQQEEILRLEDVLKDLEQDYMEISDLGTFVDVYWGPKVRLVMDELNARKLDEDDLKAAQEAGIEWHCFETEPIKNDYSRSSDLEYWMEKLNTIVPEPGSDIPSAPDLPVRDT